MPRYLYRQGEDQTMIPYLKLVIGGVLLVIILSLFGYARWEPSRYVETKADYDTFIIKAQVLAAERLAENRRKEIEYQERLKTADAARSILLNRLRDSEASTHSIGMSLFAATTQSRVCLDKSRSDEAFTRLVADLQGLAQQGDIALIDLQT